MPAVVLGLLLWLVALCSGCGETPAKLEVGYRSAAEEWMRYQDVALAEKAAAGSSDVATADDLTIASDAATADAGADTASQASGADAFTSVDAVLQDAVLQDKVSGGGSCAGQCAGFVDSVAKCLCRWDCAKFGTCCPDWVEQCKPTDASGQPLDLDWQNPPAGSCAQPSDWLQVKSNPDGDTIWLQQTDVAGKTVAVRFLLIDTPEMSSSDCMAKEAKEFTYQALVASQWQVCLVAEPGGDDTDVYGRLLRYVYVKAPGQQQPVMLNFRLLRKGLARVLYPYIKGSPYEPLALATMAQAKADKIGGWATCGWVKPK